CQEAAIRGSELPRSAFVESRGGSSSSKVGRDGATTQPCSCCTATTSSSSSSACLPSFVRTASARGSFASSTQISSTRPIAPSGDSTRNPSVSRSCGLLSAIVAILRVKASYPQRAAGNLGSFCRLLDLAELLLGPPEDV